MEAKTLHRTNRRLRPRSRTHDKSWRLDRLLVRRGIVFLSAGGALAYLAMEGAGYDIVVRQQFALVLWCIIALGFGLGVLPRSAPSRLILIPAVALAGLLAWTALGFIWTESDERTMVELARVSTYAGFVVLAICGLNRYTYSAAAAGLSAAAAGVTIIAVASRLAPESFPTALEVASSFSEGNRLTYPLDYWNAVGSWGAMTVAIGLAWSAHARREIVRVVSLIVVPVAGLAVYLSYSRGGLIASAVAVVAVLTFSRNRWTALVHGVGAAAATALVVLVARAQPEIAEATGNEGSQTVILALLGGSALCAGAVFLTRMLNADSARLARSTAKWAVPGFLLVLLLLVVIGGRGPISSAWDEFRSEDAPVAGEDPSDRLTSAGGNRNDIWTSAIDAFEEEPLTGIGPGTFEFWWLPENDPEYVRDAHSLYLEQMAELGLPGLLLLLAFLGGLTVVAIKTLASARSRNHVGACVAMLSAGAVFLVSAGIDWMWEETALGALGIGGIAIAAAGGFGRQPGRVRRGDLGKWWIRPAVVVGALLFAGLQVPGLVSSQRVRASENALADGNVEEAEALAQEAIRAEPWASTPPQQLALVLRQQGELKDARDAIRTAIDNEPTNWKWPLVLAPLETALGDRQSGIEVFLAGRKLAPQLEAYSPFSAYGRQVFSVDQLDQIFARKEARRARAAAP